MSIDLYQTALSSMQTNVQLQIIPTCTHSYNYITVCNSGTLVDFGLYFLHLNVPLDFRSAIWNIGQFSRLNVDILFFF